jgi:hypothetical protein
MIVKEITYINTKNDTRINVNILYYQDDKKVCFYGSHTDKYGIQLENSREYHLTVDKLKHWNEV